MPALYATRHPQRVERLLLVGPIPTTAAQLTRAFERLDARRDSATQRRVSELLAAATPNRATRRHAARTTTFGFLPPLPTAARCAEVEATSVRGRRRRSATRIQSVDRFTMASLGDWDWRLALGAVTAPALVIHGTMEFISH